MKDEIKSRFTPSKRKSTEFMQEAKEQYFFFKQAGYTATYDGNYRAYTKEIIKTYY